MYTFLTIGLSPIANSDLDLAPLNVLLSAVMINKRRDMDENPVTE